MHWKITGSSKPTSKSRRFMLCPLSPAYEINNCSSHEIHFRTALVYMQYVRPELTYLLMWQIGEAPSSGVLKKDGSNLTKRKSTTKSESEDHNRPCRQVQFRAAGYYRHGWLTLIEPSSHFRSRSRYSLWWNGKHWIFLQMGLLNFRLISLFCTLLFSSYFAF